MLDPWQYPDSMDQTRFEGRTIEVRMYRGWMGNSVWDDCCRRPPPHTLSGAVPWLRPCVLYVYPDEYAWSLTFEPVLEFSSSGGILSEGCSSSYPCFVTDIFFCRFGDLSAKKKKKSCGSATCGAFSMCCVPGCKLVSFCITWLLSGLLGSISLLFYCLKVNLVQVGFEVLLQKDQSMMKSVWCSCCHLVDEL